MKDVLFINTIKKYRLSSLFVKYFMISILVILIPALVFASIFLYTMRNNINSTRNSETILTCQNIASKLDRTVDYINSYYAELVSNPAVLTYIYSDTYIYSKQLSNNASEINNLISKITLSQPYIKSIYIYNPSQNYVLSTRSSAFFDSFYDTEWYPRAEISEFDRLVFFRTVSARGINDEYISFVYKYSNTYDVLSYIVFNIDCHELESMFADTGNIEAFAVYNNHELLFSNVENADFSDGISGYECENSGFTVNVNISSKIYDFKFKSYAYIFICIFILIFLTSLFVAYIVSRQYYKSVYDIVDILLTHDPSRSLDLGPVNNEFEYINSSILALYSKQNKMEEDLVTNISKLNELHVNVLQNQINPHFIHNTLNLVSLIDIEEHKGSGKISIIVKLLSDILRAVNESDQYTVSFDKELEYLKQFCMIENIKYDNSFEFIYDIDESTKNLCCVKFMLQPIVENAITHGILKTPSCRGTIKISSYIQGNDFYVSITDSGIGFDADMLQKISALLESDVILPSSHIGITNVNNRIKLIFGTKYGISIKSVQGSTCVTLHLPSKKF